MSEIIDDTDRCQECKAVIHIRGYHPWIACMLYKAGYNPKEIESNLAVHKQLQATIADKDAEIAELKLWVKDRNKIMLEQAKELSLLKEVAAAIISEDPEDHKPVCCGGSIQSMCGCMGATPISMAYHELRQILKSTINPIGDQK